MSNSNRLQFDGSQPTTQPPPQIRSSLDHPASPSPPSKEHRTSNKRHQIRRSITEFTPPGRKFNLQAHHPHGGSHYHDPRNQHQREQRRSKLHRKGLSQHARAQLEEDSTGRDLNQLHHHTGRHSLDMSRANMDMDGGRDTRNGSRVFDREARETRKTEDLKAAKKKANCRADGLKSSLLELHSFSVDTTKQLDDTYYTLLLKLSALQTTVTSIKELAETSQDIASTFDKDSRDLEHEVVSQIGSLGRFDEQQSRIENLQGRVESGREKISGLSGRVEAVREMVEGWESADREWQEKTRRKMKVIWSVVSGVLLVIMLLVWGMKSEAINTEEIGVSIGKVAQVSEGLVNTSKVIPDILRGKFGLEEDDGRDVQKELEELQEKLVKMKPEVGDAGLRALDEL